MKKYTILAGILILALGSHAQNRNDVVQLSLNNLSGTARFQSMAGAFGALGGDLSALNANPAGSAVFNNSYFSISGSNYGNSNEVSYFNGFSDTSSDRFNINQAGGVLVFKNTQRNAIWNKVSIGFNYELQNSFHNDLFVRGRGNTSVASYFVQNAEGFSTEQIGRLQGETYADAYIAIGRDLGYAAQQGFLGYETFLIDPVAQGSTSYRSNADFTGGIEQEQFIANRGYDHKFTMNLAGLLNENTYLGANLNFHSVERTRVNQFDEFGYDPNSLIQYTQFDNELYTFGNGFSFQVGAISRLNESLRIGLSYQSPTWYRLTDEIWQGINTDVLDSQSGQVNRVDVYPDVIFRFPDYRIRIPSKLTASAALVFGQTGLLSFDYGYQDFSNAELGPENDPFFAQENAAISQELKAVSTYRLGGEYRIKNLSLRAGYRFEESPYADESTVGELTAYSVGMGYQFGNTRLDLGYSHAQRDQNFSLYDTGLTSRAFNNYSLSNFNITLGFAL